MIILNQKPVYGATDSGNNLEVSFQPQLVRELGFFNWTGLAYCELKYGVIGSVIEAFEYAAIVTDSDAVAHDKFIRHLTKKQVVILIESKLAGAASLKRLERAKEKLDSEGFDCVHIVKTVKQAEALIKKAVAGNIERASKNVIRVKFGA